MQSSFKTYNLMVKMFSERLGRDNRPRRRKRSWCGGGGGVFFISRLEKKTKPKKNRRMVSQVELLNCLGWTPKKHKKGDAMRFSESVLLGLFIFELNQTVTPMKINMDAQNDGLGNVSPFKYNHFWYLC